MPEYQGDPYVGCRPECVTNTDCALDRACIRNKCMDPCPNTCGQNALCSVYNHVPMCTCPAGMAGNAFVQCSLAGININQLTTNLEFLKFPQKTFIIDNNRYIQNPLDNITIVK